MMLRRCPFPSKYAAAIMFAGMLLTLELLARFCPHTLGIDTTWRREYVSQHLRELAADVARNAQDDTSLNELIACAQSSYRFERDYAIGTLGKLGPRAEAAVPTIAEGLSSNDAYTRNAAALALSNLGTTASSAKNELIRVLTYYPSEGASTWAAEALGQFGDSSPEVVNALRIAVKTSPNNSTVDRARRAFERLMGHPMDEDGEESQ
jgi:HEAT repeat protein